MYFEKFGNVQGQKNFYFFLPALPQKGEAARTKGGAEDSR